MARAYIMLVFDDDDLIVDPLSRESRSRAFMRRLNEYRALRDQIGTGTAILCTLSEREQQDIERMRTSPEESELFTTDQDKP